MSVTGDGSDHKPGVTMGDLKDLETSLRSTMDTQMKELREMIAQLLPKGVGPTPPPLEVNSSAAHATEAEGSDELMNPHLKLLVGRRNIVRFLTYTPSTHLSLILI